MEAAPPGLPDLQSRQSRRAAISPVSLAPPRRSPPLGMCGSPARRCNVCRRAAIARRPSATRPGSGRSPAPGSAIRSARFAPFPSRHEDEPAPLLQGGSSAQSCLTIASPYPDNRPKKRGTPLNRLDRFCTALTTMVDHRRKTKAISSGHAGQGPVSAMTNGSPHRGTCGKSLLTPLLQIARGGHQAA